MNHRPETREGRCQRDFHLAGHGDCPELSEPAGRSRHVPLPDGPSWWLHRLGRREGPPGPRGYLDPESEEPQHDFRLSGVADRQWPRGTAQSDSELVRSGVAAFHDPAQCAQFRAVGSAFAGWDQGDSETPQRCAAVSAVVGTVTEHGVRSTGLGPVRSLLSTP